MKKILIILGLIFIGLRTIAGEVELLDMAGMNMTNFWDRNGKYEQKVLEVGTKIINANKLDKRIAIRVDRHTRIVNADSNYINKTVTVYYGLLPYIDNDDELASVLGHEMGHAIDAYGGFSNGQICG